MKYQVLVSNIGTVYDGDSGKEARETYEEYVRESSRLVGRASKESVTLMMDGEPTMEYYPLPNRVRQRYSIIPGR